MCLDLIIFLIPLSLLLAALPYIWGITAPFIIGGLLYFLAKPLNKIFLEKSFPKGLCAFLSLGIISILLFFFLRFVGGKIFQELYAFTQNPPQIYSRAIEGASAKITGIIEKTQSQSTFLSSFVPSLSKVLSEEMAKIVSYISNLLISFAKTLPSLFISAFASIFTTFFLLKDGESIFAFFRKFFGSKLYNGFLAMKQTFLSVAALYLKAQFIIGLIIFSILLLGFLLLRVKYAFVLALLTALLDAVPVFGTGTILIPMALFNFLTQNNSLGWGLCVLYGITLLSRQLCEPKILGKTLGVHPLLAVFSLYAGMKLFGVFGLIFGPFFAIFLKILLFRE